jgi:Ca-activated chloride channel homolog
MSLLKDVKINLREQKKLSDEELTKLDDHIQERYAKLMDYAKEKHAAKSENLKAERERVIKLIQEFADEARSQ